MEESELNEYWITYADEANYMMRCRSDADATKLIYFANELSTGDAPYRITAAVNRDTLTDVMPN